MSKAGYGSFLEIKNEWSSREVINALAYESFLNDYNIAFSELNKGN